MTAVNLNWGLKRVFNKVIKEDPSNRFNKALLEAKDIEKEDKEMCSKIGEYGKSIIENIYEKNNIKSRNLPINILTHCNAGWLATVDWGTALAPIYKAHRQGLTFIFGLMKQGLEIKGLALHHLNSKVKTYHIQ